MLIRSRLNRVFTYALSACALFAPVEARAQHYIDLPGTQPGGLAEATPLDNAGPCGITCHYSRDSTMPTAMPYDGWIGSMMGNSMRDPLFLAALTVAEQDAPGVGDWCLRCHTPPGFVGGRTRGTPTASRGLDLMSGDRDGINCDSCHRMVATTNLGNAQYQFSPSETRFGPYATIESIRHPGAVSTWLPDSRMCGTCHEITNPTQPQRNADGTDSGRRFPLDTTYGEWSQSVFAVAGSPDARTCQDCHMPRIGMPGRVSTNASAMLRENPRRHDLTGANAWGLRVLAAMRNDVSSGEFYDPDIVPYYENGARRAEAILRSAATVELREAPRMVTAGDRVTAVARITNLSGHRLPAGYADGRRVWLELAIVDADRRETVISGAYDTTTAHLDTADTQLKLYEAVQGRIGMGREDHLALHDTVIRDTRLPPRGYRPLPGHEPVGVDFSGGTDGALRHWDDARYTFTIPTGLRGPLTLRVRARYQTTTREYVEFLARENHTDERGRELLARYEASGRAAPMNIAEATAEIALAGSTATDGGLSDVPSDRVTSDVSADVTRPNDSATTDAATPDARPADTGTVAPAPTPAPTGCGCRVGSPSQGRIPVAPFALCAIALGSVVRRRRTSRHAA